jgi:hypothetical protein
MSQQTVTITSRDDQIIIRTPWRESLVVSAQVVGDKYHVYVTLPEGYTQRPGVGATTIFERESRRLASYEEGVAFAEAALPHD